MSKRKRGAASKDDRPGIDLGPAIRRATPPAPAAPPADASVLEVARFAAALVHADPQRQIVKEDRADETLPNAPLVRGARVLDPLHMAYRSQKLSRRQWQGVEGFRDDVVLAGGARPNAPDRLPGRSGQPSQTWPHEQQLFALRRVQRTWQRLSADQRAICSWCVVEHRTVTAFALDQHIRKERASDLLHSLLEILARHHANQPYLR